MARSLFGGRASDSVATLFNIGARSVLSPPTQTVTLEVWSGPEADGGTRLTDLLAADGTTAITAVTVPASAHGQIPVFYGPDGVTQVWFRDTEGDFYRLDADAGPAAARAVEAADRAEAVGATTDEQVESSLQARGLPLNGSDLSASTVGKAGEVHGGTVPKPLRPPTLTIVEAWPNARTPRNARVLWVENNGLTIYAYSDDASLYKSTDGGTVWTHRAYLNWQPFAQNSFLKTSVGTLLTVSISGGVHEVRRSTDDGATWTKVADLQAGQSPLGTQSWCIDKSNDHIYYGEYGGSGKTEMNLYRSTDDGLTWPVFHAFPGAASTSADKINHIHAVQYDHVTQRVWVCVGDSGDATGLYRVNDARTGAVPMVTNRMLPPGTWDAGGFFDAPRAIGIMPFADYIAWASDSTSNPGLFRVARTELGKANPVVERIYRTNSTNWWTAKANAAGTRWIFTSSQEDAATAIDRQVHIYAVEDQGARIYEIGTVPQVDVSVPAGSLMPVGLPEDQGDFIHMTARNVVAAGSNAAWRLRVGDGAPAVPLPSPAAPVMAWRTASSGHLTGLAPSSSQIFHGDMAQTFARKLRIFEANAVSTDGSAGRLGVRVEDAAGNLLYEFFSPSARYSGRKEGAPFLAEFTLAAATVIHVKAVNIHTGSSVAGVASITYGWA